MYWMKTDTHIHEGRAMNDPIIKFYRKVGLGERADHDLENTLLALQGVAIIAGVAVVVGLFFLP